MVDGNPIRAQLNAPIPLSLSTQHACWARAERTSRFASSHGSTSVSLAPARRAPSP
jgi:hypothetical protein